MSAREVRREPVESRMPEVPFRELADWCARVLREAAKRESERGTAA